MTHACPADVSRRVIVTHLYPCLQPGGYCPQCHRHAFEPASHDEASNFHLDPRFLPAYILTRRAMSARPNLAGQPEWQRRCRDEVMAALGQGQAVTACHIVFHVSDPRLLIWTKSARQQAQQHGQHHDGCTYEVASCSARPTWRALSVRPCSWGRELAHRRCGRACWIGHVG